MGIVWEAYHKGVPLLGVPENHPWGVFQFGVLKQPPRHAEAQREERYEDRAAKRRRQHPVEWPREALPALPALPEVGGDVWRKTGARSKETHGWKSLGGGMCGF